MDNHRQILFAGGTALIIFLLACNLPIYNLVDEDELYRAGDQVTPDVLKTETADLERAMVENFNSGRVYQSNPNGPAVTSDDCDFGFPTGEDIRLETKLTDNNDPTQEGYHWDRSSITMRKPDGSVVTYMRESEVDKFLFCRTADDDMFDECIRLTPQGFILEVYTHSKDLCYSLGYERQEEGAAIVIPEVAPPGAGEDWPIEACIATDQLDIQTSNVVENEMYDENSGELEYLSCEYDITFQNLSDKPIDPYFFEHYIYSGENKSGWLGYPDLEPGGSKVRTGNDIYRYPSSKDQASGSYLLLRLGGIYAVPGCQWIDMQDYDLLQNYSVRIPPPCTVIGLPEGD